MSRIKATKIVFSSEYPFRKFKNLEIPLSPRLTLLCGHNGVGKSTILGLLSSLSGFTKGSDKSYFGKTFDASIADIVYIDHATEVAAPKAAQTLAEPTVHYDINGKVLVKECSLTRRGAAPRARVVSRNVPHKKFITDGIEVGPDAKVPLPTIFLGVSRMLPVGESPDSRVQNTVGEKWHKDDSDFMLNFVKRVIPGAGAATGAISVNRIKLTSKLSTHPKYPYSPRSVSLGQDSLGAIVTALASFHRIKRKLGASYSGGLLVIDELDASFHPHAIGVLIRELRAVAEDLSLQIVATSHSTRLIEAVHPDGHSKGAKGKDSVVYLRNTRSPEFDPDFGLADILDDMELTPPKPALKVPQIKVYFEDDEACEVFKVLTSRELIKRVQAAHNIVISPMPLGIGCSSLGMLPEKDPYFKTVALIVDADATKPRNAPSNLIDLPGAIGPNGKGLSPERTIIQYIRLLVNEPKEKHPIAWSDTRLRKYSQDSLEMNLLAGYDDPLDRKQAKAWWREKSDFLTRWGLYDIWAKAHPELIAAYEVSFEKGVKSAAKERRRQEELSKRGGVR